MNRIQESDNSELYHTIDSATDKLDDIAKQMNEIQLELKIIRKHLLDEQYRILRGEQHD